MPTPESCPSATNSTSSSTKTLPQFHSCTPLIPSTPLSSLANRPVLLKLDVLQPSGSFKIRGVGRACAVAVAKGARKLVGSSGGNAGVAMAHAAHHLNVPLVLCVPDNVHNIILHKLKEYDTVDVRKCGENWDAANAEAQRLLAMDQDAAFVHPFDQQEVWDGNSTIVEEIFEQMKELASAEKRSVKTPAAIVTCIGGGGLAAGIIDGLRKVGWSSVPLVGMETEGSKCFHLSVKEGRLVKLPKLDTIARSLGALAVCPRLFEQAKEHRIVSRVVSDSQALDACFRFSDDHRMLVEPACGASLAALYSGLDLDLEAESDLGSEADLPFDQRSPIVMIVCGGNVASIEQFLEWKQQLDM